MSLANLERALAQGKRKGGVENRPSDGGQMCGDIDMRIAPDGAWHYMGSPIGRKRLVKLFSSVLEKDESGDFWLVTPAEMCRIRVDDAPFTAVEMTFEGDGDGQTLIFRTNLDEIVKAGPENRLRVDIDAKTGEPRPYVHVRGGLEALIVRAVFYDLVEMAEERERAGETILGVWSGGIFFEIGGLGENGGAC